MSSSIGWGAGLQSSSFVQGMGFESAQGLNKGKIKGFIKSINQLNTGWCHTAIKFHLHYLTVIPLNNSVELYTNLDIPVP